MSNVIDFKKKAQERQNQTTNPDQTPASSLDNTIQKNKENSERVKKERAKNNQSVIRSYRLKY